MHIDNKNKNPSDVFFPKSAFFSPAVDGFADAVLHLREDGGLSGVASGVDGLEFCEKFPTQKWLVLDGDEGEQPPDDGAQLEIVDLGKFRFEQRPRVVGVGGDGATPSKDGGGGMSGGYGPIREH